VAKNESRQEVSGQKELILNENGVKDDYTKLSPPVGLVMKVAIDYEPPADEMNKIKKALERVSLLIWQETWGNMYLAKAIIHKNTRDGYITLQKSPRDRPDTSGWFDGAFTVSTNLLNIAPAKPEVGIRVMAAGLLHEFNHSMFHLPNEHPANPSDSESSRRKRDSPDWAAGQGCLPSGGRTCKNRQGEEMPKKKCIMDQRSRMTELCPDCENLIARRFTKWGFPVLEESTEWASKHPVPASEIVIVNH
jgi:hypothetical protein